MSRSGNSPRKKTIKKEDNLAEIDVHESFNHLSIDNGNNVVHSSQAVSQENHPPPRGFNLVDITVCDVIKAAAPDSPVHFAELYLKEVCKKSESIEPIKNGNKAKLTEAENVITYYYGGNRYNDLKTAWTNRQGGIRKKFYDFMRQNENKNIICALTSSDKKFYYVFLYGCYVPFADACCKMKLKMTYFECYGIPDIYAQEESIFIIQLPKNRQTNIIKLDVKTGHKLSL